MNDLPTLAAGLFLSAFVGLACAAAPVRDLHDFDGTTGGAQPDGELVADPQGRLIGTTVSGGDFDQGTLYRLTRATTAGGVAAVEILHSFQQSEGGQPQGGALVGADGAFYGTASAGGKYNGGTVWRFDPNTRLLTTLHHFNPTSFPADGSGPIAGLTAGPNGLLVGTTVANGPNGHGTAFAISPAGDIADYQTLYAFGLFPGGRAPNHGRLAASGNTFYGVTSSGGTNSLAQWGVAYSLTYAPDSNSWSEAVIHYFGTVDNDGGSPTGGLMLDETGGLLGCGPGGRYSSGSVYRLTPLGGGAWQQNVLTSLGANSGDPYARAGMLCWVAPDESGRLIGTSAGGGSFGHGSVFTMPADGGGTTVVHSFGATPGAGATPASPVFPLRHGVYVGATAVGGGGPGAGTIYAIKP